MNAIPVVAERPRSVSTLRPTAKLRLLLRRELWEHYGGFLWAPAAAGVCFLLSSVLFGTAEMGRPGSFVPLWVWVSGIDVLRVWMVSAHPGQLQDRGLAVDVSLYLACVWPFVALGGAVFSYCLGALYDERKDRSILFWKSLPLSDGTVVLAKVASALLVAPGIAIALAIVTMCGFLVLISVMMLVHGGDPVRSLWMVGSPLAVAGSLVASMPAYAVWALPTVGWLLLCSAWAKEKPLLWAVLIPVFAGIFVAWAHAVYDIDVAPLWFWKNVAARMLLGVVPGSWLAFTGVVLKHAAHGSEVTRDAASGYLASTYKLFTTPQPWVGAAAGLTMIYGAIRVRRWREGD